MRPMGLYAVRPLRTCVKQVFSHPLHPNAHGLGPLPPVYPLSLQGFNTKNLLARIPCPPSLMAPPLWVRVSP
jgi:hypothetical protein